MTKVMIVVDSPQAGVRGARAALALAGTPIKSVTFVAVVPETTSLTPLAPMPVSVERLREEALWGARRWCIDGARALPPSVHVSHELKTGRLLPAVKASIDADGPDLVIVCPRGGWRHASRVARLARSCTVPLVWF